MATDVPSVTDVRAASPELVRTVFWVLATMVLSRLVFAVFTAAKVAFLVAAGAQANLPLVYGVVVGLPLGSVFITTVCYLLLVMKVHLLPRPGGMALLGVGVLHLVGGGLAAGLPLMEAGATTVLARSLPVSQLSGVLTALNLGAPVHAAASTVGVGCVLVFAWLRSRAEAS